MYVEQMYGVVVMDFEKALDMSTQMKAMSDEVVTAIRQCQAAQWGVVALKYEDGVLRLETLDEPYEPNVRVYPGDAF